MSDGRWFKSSRPDQNSQRRGISSPLLGTSLRFVEYPPQSMRFARSESDAQRFISLRDLKQRPCKRVSGGKESFPLSNYSYEVAKESSEHLNEVKMRALRGNCQKFPLKERNLERREVVQIQSPRPKFPKKGDFIPPLRHFASLR